jgi:putative membrane protein
MMWDWHGYGWWWFVVMPFGMLVFWGAVAWVVVTLARANKPDGSARASHGAQRILDARYASGEIDADEYRRRSDDLRDTSSRTG